MSTIDISALTKALFDAQGDGGSTVASADFQGLTLTQALEIQHLVLVQTGGGAPAAKIGMTPDGGATTAPIYKGMFLVDGDTLTLPARGIAGIELEVAVRLRADLTPDFATADDAAFLDLIDEFVLAIEIVGSRFDDRSKAGPWGPLADNMVTAGLVQSPATPLPRKAYVDGTEQMIEIDGKPVYTTPAKHPFGNVFAPLRAYAGWPQPNALPLRAGMLVTTGSLCNGVVPITGPCTVRARLGDNWIGMRFE